MYSTPWCPYCVAARRLFDTLGVPYEDIDVSADRALRARMAERAGRYTVPQIWIGEQHVGGFDDIDELHRRGKLIPMLDESSQRASAGNA